MLWSDMKINTWAVFWKDTCVHDLWVISEREKKDESLREESAEFIHSFIHAFIQKVFIEHLSPEQKIMIKSDKVCSLIVIP